MVDRFDIRDTDFVAHSIECGENRKRMRLFVRSKTQDKIPVVDPAQARIPVSVPRQQLAAMNDDVRVDEIGGYQRGPIKQFPSTLVLSRP